jgi:hypothetical protein
VSSPLDRITAMIASHECENCESVEERVFTDSWTGMELCPTCLAGIINEVNMSPATDGPDNLKQLLDGDD